MSRCEPLRHPSIESQGVKLGRASDFYLQPGEYRVAEGESRIHTLLGSCVSIALWHPGLRVGAMCHFLLWFRPFGVAGTLDARYAEDAITLMLRGLQRYGARPEAYQAKLFGGGNMFPHSPGDGEARVGEKNGLAARRLLQERGIPIVSESLFGNGYRRIIFEIKSGTVWSRQVAPPDFAEQRGAR
jgi:chemotaxis protein CheD